MSGVNKVIIVGRLGADPELKAVGSGSVARLSIATSENWVDKEGQKQERTEWHRIVVWGRLAEICGLVLVDQIDLHLHPDAQRAVVPTLARAFPVLQFVITTHSPIVVGSVWRSNVRTIEDTPNGSRIVASAREVFGLSADQLLAGDHFGVATTRNVTFDRHVQREAYAARNGDPEAALRVLRLLTLGGGAINEAAPATAARSR